MTRETMREVDHTNPYTGEAFGANGGVFTRGPAVADGGTADQEMCEVDHTAPDGDGANEVWDRGPDADPTDEANSPETVGADDE